MDPHLTPTITWAIRSIMAKKSTINKSAITGKILSDAAAARHPKTSYKQTVMKGPVKHHRDPEPE